MAAVEIEKTFTIEQTRILKEAGLIDTVK